MYDFIIIALLAIILVAVIFVLITIIKNKTNESNIEIKRVIYDTIKEEMEELNRSFSNKLEFQTRSLESLNKGLFDKIDIRITNLENKNNEIKEALNSFNRQYSDDFSKFKNDNIEFFNRLLKDNQKTADSLKEKLSEEIKEFNKQVKDVLKEFDESLRNKITEFNNQTKESFERLEKTVGTNLTSLREDNNKKLEQINVTVGEKLEKTLEGRLKQSFDNVIEQIGGVNKAIGEIKGLANDVGSLKTVLTNVKTKGIVGEVILGNIIKDILTVGQYEENIVTKKNSSERVEFAIKMPGAHDEYIYLPIDSKLPLESYHKIKDGMDAGNPEMVKEGRKELRLSIRKYAKDVSEKYIDVPNTTDFAIIFLPIEGLYIEALNMGLFEEIQREFRVNIAGPTTLTAILNSLQMGFKTLVIQKKSADVFKLLGAVKTEFEKFASVLEKTQKKVGEASDELDKLVGTRTRMIQSKLRSVESLEEADSKILLGIDE